MAASAEQIRCCQAFISTFTRFDNHIDARLAHTAMGIRLEEEQALQHGAGSYIDLFRGSNLKRTLTVIWMFVGFGMAGYV